MVTPAEPIGRASATPAGTPPAPVAPTGRVVPQTPAPARGAVPKPTVPKPTVPKPTVPKPTVPKLTDDPIGDPPSPASAWNIANGLTMFRLVLVPVFVYALFAGTGHERGLRFLAWAIFAVASITDRIDGDIARKRGLVTEFGKLADPIADKALVGAALIGLSILGDLPWWVTVVMLAREVGVTLLRFWVIRHGVIPASRGGKVKTLLQAIATGLFVLIPLGHWLRPIAWTFMIVAMIVALATGADYVARAARLRRDARTAAAARPSV